MKYMVCNCNSYGNIDYGIPILFKSNDYRTSTNVGLKYIPLPQIPFYKRNVSVPAGTPLLEIKDDSFKTQYVKSYDQKYRKWDSKGKPNLPLPLPRTHYMRIVKEEMFRKPPAPRKFGLVEYKEEYCLKQPEAIQDKIQNIGAQTVCSISSIGRSEQPRIKIEEKGVMKQLDTYVSSNQISYIPFTKDQLHAVKTESLTFYNSKTCPELQRIKVRKPINDETKFKKHIKDRIIPDLVYRVPYSGISTEYKSNYLGPTKGCLYIESFDSGVQFKDSLSNPNKWQTLAAPNMYCTEYCHIGSGRNVQAAVNTNKEKNENKHDDCTQINK